MTKKKRMRRNEKKLTRAVDTIASIIESIASSMKGEIDSGGNWDIKQLKELTGAAKELSVLICALNTDGDEKTGDHITVYFEGDSKEWAQ